MKPNKKLILIVAAVVVLGAWGAHRLWNGRATDSLRLSGNIELTQVDVAFKMPGRLVERPVDEGEAVKKGQVLARLDTEQLRRQRDREQAGVSAASSQVQQTISAVRYQKEAIEADVQLKQAEVRAARARLAEMLAGSRAQEIGETQAALDQALSEEQRAARDWERAQVLIKKDNISTQQHDQFQARYKAAAAAARQARERLALVKEGPRQEEIESARAQLARAQAALRFGEAAWLDLKRREQEIESRRAEMERARAQVSVLDSQLDDAVAQSPIDGVVLSKAAEVGQVVAAGTTVLTVGDIDHPWFRGYINEKDLGRVKLGARVRVTTDSHPGKVYWGRLSFIASEAEFTPKQIQTAEERVKLVYRVKIEVPNPDRELKSNMPVDAEILLKE